MALIMNNSMQDVWDILLSAAEDRAGVRWFSKRSDSSVTLGSIAQSAKELDTVASSSLRGWDCFVHLNPSRKVKGSRAKSSDVNDWSFVLIDIDPVDVNEDDLMPNDMQYILRTKVDFIQGKAEELLGTLLHPAIIYTGRGYHLWLRLKPIPIWNRMPTRAWINGDPGYREGKQIENATRNFLTELAKDVPEGVRIDILPDLARIARLPNSINHKTGRYARLIQSGSQQDIGQIILDKFGRQTAREDVAAHPEWFKPKKCEYPIHDWVEDVLIQPGYTVIITDPDHGTFDWRDVFWTLTLRARNYLDRGAAEGSRHESVYACCKSLYEKGVSRESAFDALWVGNTRSDRMLPLTEVKRQIRRIYGGGD